MHPFIVSGILVNKKLFCFSFIIYSMSCLMYFMTNLFAMFLILICLFLRLIILFVYIFCNFFALCHHQQISASYF